MWPRLSTALFDSTQAAAGLEHLEIEIKRRSAKLARGERDRRVECVVTYSDLLQDALSWVAGPRRKSRPVLRSRELTAHALPSYRTVARAASALRSPGGPPHACAVGMRGALTIAMAVPWPCHGRAGGGVRVGRRRAEPLRLAA